MKTAYFILLVTSLTAVIWNRKLLPSKLLVFIPLIALALVQLLLLQFGTMDLGILMSIIHGYHFIAFPLFIIYFYKSLNYIKWKKIFLASIPLFYLGGNSPL